MSYDRMSENGDCKTRAREADSLRTVAFFGVALGLGTWLPNMMASQGMTITKSLTYTLGMQCAFPCASIFMMFALERFGRKITATTAFVRWFRAIR